MAVPVARPCVEYETVDGGYEVARYGDCVVDKLLDVQAQHAGGVWGENFVAKVSMTYDTGEGAIRLSVAPGDSTHGAVYRDMVLCHPYTSNPDQGGCPLRQRLQAYLQEHPDPPAGYGHGHSRRLMKVACSSLVFDESGERVLLTRRAGALRTFPNAWVFPGGHVDYPDDECLEDACLRELNEECGIRIEPAFRAGPHERKKSTSAYDQALKSELSQEWGIDGAVSPPSNALRRRASVVSTVRVEETASSGVQRAARQEVEEDLETKRGLSEVWGLELDARGDVVPDEEPPRALRKRLMSMNSFAREEKPRPKLTRRKSQIERAIDREITEEWGVDVRDDDADAPPPPTDEHPQYDGERVDVQQLNDLSETWGTEIAQGMMNPIPRACQAQANEDFGCDIAQGMVGSPSGKKEQHVHKAEAEYVYIHPTDAGKRSRVTVQPFFLWESASLPRDAPPAGALELPGSQVLIIYFKVTLHDLPADAVPLTHQAAEVSASAWVDVRLLLDRRKFSSLPPDDQLSVSTPSPQTVTGHETRQDDDGTWGIEPARFSIQQILPPYNNVTEEEGMPRAPEIALQAAFQPDFS